MTERIHMGKDFDSGAAMTSELFSVGPKVSGAGGDTAFRSATKQLTNA